MESKINKKRDRRTWCMATSAASSHTGKRKQAQRRFRVPVAGAPLIFKDCIPLRRARDSILLTFLVMS